MCEFDPRCEGSDALVGNALAQIAMGRWAVTGIYGDADTTPFAYTTGLTEFGRPELVITGIAPAPACRILNAAGHRITAGAAFSPGDTVDRVLAEPYLPYVLPVVDDAELTVTRLLYGPDVEALQLVWPDRYGHYPWEPEFTIDRDQQPLLGLPLAA